MKAITFTEFGAADVLSLTDLPEPLVAPDGVLIRVRAAGVNPVDAKVRSGYLQTAFPHHFPVVPGWDVAGVVEAVGPAVTAFTAGDEVMGYARKDHIQGGTYAELVAVSERVLAPVPASLDFAEAAALPLAGLAAWQSLCTLDIGPGDVVVVHAGAGGVGHFAVQLARARGAARVIATASPHNSDFLASLGAEPVDYGAGLVSRIAELVGGDGKVDAALDFVGGEALEAAGAMVRNPRRHSSIVNAQQVLAQGGRYVFVRPNGEQLRELGRIAESGRLRVEIAHRLPLAQASDAHRLIEGGHVRGKIVLLV